MALCYLDRAFCDASTEGRCINTSCYRFFGPDQRAAAERWWGSSEAPVAFLVGHSCDALIPPPPALPSE